MLGIARFLTQCSKLLQLLLQQAQFTNSVGNVTNMLIKQCIHGATIF